MLLPMTTFWSNYGMNNKGAWFPLGAPPNTGFQFPTSMVVPPVL